MRVNLIVMISLTICLSASAQVDVDPAGGTVDFIYRKTNIHQVSEIPGAIRSVYRIDSVRAHFNLAADSIRAQYHTALQKIDAESNKLKKDIDSLRGSDLAATTHMKDLDSLNGLRQATESKFASRFNTLKAETTDKLEAFHLPPEYRQPLENLTKKVNGMNLAGDLGKIPEFKIPHFKLPEIGGIGDLRSTAGQMSEIDDLGQLPPIEIPGGDLGEVSQRVQGYGADVKNITQGNLNGMQTLSESIEEQATKIEGLDELQKQSGILDGHKASLDQMKQTPKAKQQIVAIAKKAAVDHFAGKQEQLKAAMEKISKYKQKFASASSIKDLPKRPPNAMKGKPFVERLAPGLYFQYQQKNFYLIDVNPYIGYRISGRLTAGIGWNKRYAYDKGKRAFNPDARIFGPRGYADVKAGKGFIAHFEAECMNAFVPSRLAGNPDDGEREWVWSFMTGLKKEYRICKNLKGTALIQYNWLNRYYKAPYVDRLNSRIGFEYILKQGVKKQP